MSLERSRIMGDSNRRSASVEMHIDQFSIQSGNWQQEPANIRILRSAPRRSRRGRGSLLMVFEPTHQSRPPRTLYDQIAEVISDIYYGQSGSLTRGLRDGLLAANELLFERNLREDSAHHVALGLTCVALRDDQVFMGRIGPSLVSHIHAGKLIRFPADSIWWVTEAPPAAALNREPPAGARRDVEPDLYHASIAGGDVLLISSTSLARLASEQVLLSAVAHSRGGRLRDALEALTSGRDVSVAIVEWPGEGENVIETPPVAAEPSFEEPSAPIAGPAEVQEPSIPVPYSGAAPWPEAEEPVAVSEETIAIESTPFVQEDITPSKTPEAFHEKAGAEQEEEPPWEEEAASEIEAREEEVATSERKTAPKGPDFVVIGDALRRGMKRLLASIGDTLLRILPERMAPPPPPQPPPQTHPPPGVKV